jgi:hypothetical protein
MDEIGGGGGTDLPDRRESVDFRVDFAAVAFGVDGVFAAAAAAGAFTWVFAVAAVAGDSVGVAGD